MLPTKVQLPTTKRAAARDVTRFRRSKSELRYDQTLLRLTRGFDFTPVQHDDIPRHTKYLHLLPTLFQLKFQVVNY